MKYVLNGGLINALKTETFCCLSCFGYPYL